MNIRPIIDSFLRSEYFSNWQSEHIESGGYSRNTDLRDRYERCMDAVENGADGSTHREHIEDMREAFRNWLHYGAKRSKFAEYPYRLEDRAMRHFDELETWHEQNGSLDEEVG